MSTRKHMPLAITMGDPAGIGPEIIVKSFVDPASQKRWCTEQNLRPIVIGDINRLRQMRDRLGAKFHINPIIDVAECSDDPAMMNVIQVGEATDDLPYGEISTKAGQAAFDYIVHAIDLATAGLISGIVTSPINKEAMAKANVPYPGHTEIMAERGGGNQTAMMLVNKTIRVVLVTIHVPLAKVCSLITQESELRAIHLSYRAGIELGINRPRIAVAGLNPHAGENGLFGREELDIIAPAIETAVSQGIDVSGPWPGDTVFCRARQGEFDLVIAQYHDQGLIPIKYMGIADGVNITIGLPFVRTSPDHGTAFDIAGKGTADHTSLLTSIEYAQRLIQARSYDTPGLLVKRC